MQMPLRYNISDWHQLTDVRSNNSRDLFITVTDFVQDKRLSGTRIQVNHRDFGVLFTCLVNAHGNMISELEENIIYELTPKQILLQLEVFGFFVTFEPKKHLSGNQISFLMTLKGLGYDKLRVLNVWYSENGVKVFKWYIVAFNIKQNPDWINNGYSPSEKEYATALQNGSAVNVSALSNEKHWDWSWLSYVANIDDILEDNS